MSPDTNFEVDIMPEVEPGQTLLVGLATPGMAGVTAVEHLVRHCESGEIGHVTPDALPAITPVEDGYPRHHTRLYNLLDHDLTVLVGELFVPVWAARAFTETLLTWVERHAIEELALLHAVPYPHGPEDHKVFTIATDEYRSRRLTDSKAQPLRGGFLDGVAGELASRSLAADAPPVGIYVTPAHPPGPDVDAALLFLDVVENVYNLEVDLTELEDLSEQIKEYYTTLAEQLGALQRSEEELRNREFTEDRMFM